jgi:hypothetical protein
MATDAYVPTEVTFRGQVIDEAVIVTFYDADSDAPHGSLTTPKPLPVGERGGPLVVVGSRDKKQWRVTVPAIEVRNRTAVGFEYTIVGKLERSMLSEDSTAGDQRAGPRLENLGATF